MAQQKEPLNLILVKTLETTNGDETCFLTKNIPYIRTH